jgi:RimJ/RimL family protein N-acetyltransferase
MTKWPDSYKHFPSLTTDTIHNSYALRPIHWDDRVAIREWRNAQIDVLRQIEPLSTPDQDLYFTETVLPQFDQEFPAQLVFAFLEESKLVGYGALVHIHWGDHRAEVSFLTDPGRLNPTTFAADWSAYLRLLKPLAKELGLHKLTTETYSLRSDLIPILEDNGFVQEGVLREHHFVNGKFTDSQVHGLIL